MRAETEKWKSNGSTAGWEVERLENVVGRLGEWKLGDEGTDENGDGEIEMEWEYG